MCKLENLENVHVALGLLPSAIGDRPNSNYDGPVNRTWGAQVQPGCQSGRCQDDDQCGTEAVDGLPRRAGHCRTTREKQIKETTCERGEGWGVLSWHWGSDDRNWTHINPSFYFVARGR
jgi:hypothetical protein